MRQPNMMIMSDYYKQGHPEFYPKGLNYLFTCGTARDTRLSIDKMVQWGIQGYAMDYLIERFNETFFHKDKAKAVDEVRKFIGETFDCSSFDINRIADLHDYGKLPVRLWALPEGTIVPIYKQKDNPGVVQVPFMAYENTHPEFAWMAEYLESITSAQTWYPIVAATISKFGYRDTVDKHWKISVDTQPGHTAISEFGFRGCEGSEGGIMASAGFLTSFDKTATCPAVQYVKDYYGEGVGLKEIGSGMSSTEHSVMCSNYSVDGNEDAFMHRLFTEIAPHGNISVVSDSYDYFGRLQALGAGKLKEDILNRENGAVYVRGDSGNPLHIICGSRKFKLFKTQKQFEEFLNTPTLSEDSYYYCKVLKPDISGFDYYTVSKTLYGPANKGDVNIYYPTYEEIGTIGALFDNFGGYINSKGYIVINNKVRGIYGDSITPYLADRIYTDLEDGGFAANNVALGAGSFSMQAWEEYENGVRILKPHTRDTFGIAFKATYCEVNGKEHQIFKDPKTDIHQFKKSQRGMVRVYRDENGVIHAQDHLSREEFYERASENMLRPIFEESKMLVTENIRDIRNRLHENQF